MGAVAFEQSLKLVKAVDTRSDFASYVPRDGISLDFLLQHLADAKLGSNPIQSMYDLEQYVLQQTKRWHCSFSELLRCHPSHKRAVVDKAEFFVSFAYSTDFETILSALDKFRRKQRGAEDMFVWNSIFAVNQHFGRSKEEKLTAPVIYPKGWFKDAFQQCIPSIGNVLFVMSPLEKPVALQRLWCIYELYLTILDENCTLDVILSETDEEYLISNLLVSSESILAYISAVRAENAVSSNPDQEKKLRAQIESFAGGYSAINESIQDRLREWFAYAATQYIQDQKAEYKREDMAKYLELLGTVTKMFVEAGRFDDASPLANERLAECRTHYGNEHAECVSLSSSRYIHELILGRPWR